DLVAAELRHVDAAEETDRHTHQSGQQQQLCAADDSICHSAASFADWSRQLCEEVPVNGSAAVVDQMAKNKKQDRDSNQRAHAGHRQHEAANQFAPAKTSGHALPIPAPRWVVSSIIS